MNSGRRPFPVQNASPLFCALYDRNGQSCTFITPRRRHGRCRLATARPSVAGEAARHAGAADASGPPEGVRGAWWSAARFILRRDHAEDDVVATRAQAVALPSAAPAAPAGQGPSDCRRSFATPVFTRPDSGCWHAREGRTCLAACSPVQNVGAGEAGGAHREARAHPV